jgi:hypothetical protein
MGIPSLPPPKRKIPLLPPIAIAPTQNKFKEVPVAGKKYELFVGKKNRGKKIIVYAASGMGKTTLSSMAPNPVFVAADDGIDEVVNPKTKEVIPHYKAGSYEDVRNILGDKSLFKKFDTVVVDTLSEAEIFAKGFILRTIKKDGKFVTNLEEFGWGKGYSHLSEAVNIIKYDLQNLVDAGKNVIVVCQLAPIKIANSGGEEWLCDAPKLVYRPYVNATAALDIVEWSDHCFRIGYSDILVTKNRASASGERAIFVHPQIHFQAKSRTIPPEFPVVSFSSPSDDSIWKFIFENAWKNINSE